MAQTLAQRSVIPETDAERIDRLEQGILFLAAELARYRTEQCRVRAFEDIWASSPPPPPPSRPRPDLRVVTDESCRLLLKAARR